MKNEDYLERVFYNVIKEKNIKFDGLFGLMLKGLICLVGTNLIYPIGKLGNDVEIHFLHYKSETEAQEKWNRRLKRMNFNNILFKFSDNDMSNLKLIKCLAMDKIIAKYFFWEVNMIKIRKINIFLLIMFLCCNFSLNSKSVYCQKKNHFKYIYNTVYEMKEADLKEGDIVVTKGYKNIEDNGGALYKIVNCDEFYNDLPNDIKAVAYRGDKWGLGNPVFEKTPVDEYGNHTLKNALVAEIISEDIITPEQWGCVGDGKIDNTEALIQMFAHIKSGYIKFKENSTYLMKSRSLNKKGIYNNDLRCNYNEYLWLMCGAIVGGAAQGKPVMANIDGVVLDGNGSTIKIDNNDFAKSTNDFGIFQFAKSIKNLEIKNFTFDGNGLNQLNYKNDSEIVNMRTTNHSIVYLPGIYKEVNGDLGGENCTLSSIGIDVKDFMDIENEFSNVKIHDNKFINSGTIVDTQDCGGDFILLINPKISHDVYIENNTFENWGRWVFSIDLGGEGEFFENYKFNNNTCIQNDNNKLTSGRYRGLGWIDFEAKKCFKNLEVCNNLVKGLECFAINGAGEKSENIIFNNNNISRVDRPYKSAYQYFINFYGVQVNNFVMKNNILNTPYAVSPGYTINNINFENNNLKSPLQLKGLYGDIIINNNNREDKGVIVQVLGLTLPTYIKEKELHCSFQFTNNIGGIDGAGKEAMFFDPENPGKYKYISLKIEGNDSKIFNLSAWDSDKFTFDPTQIDNTSDYKFAVRGAEFTKPTSYNAINNPVEGCGIYKEGRIVSKNINMNRMEIAYYYNKYELINNVSLKCTETGYFPAAYNDIYFKAGEKVLKNQYIYTDTDIYISCNSGILGNNLTHKSGTKMCGEVNMLHLCKLAKFEVLK